MNEGTAKIRIKIGQLEVEYEGEASFLGDGLFNLLEKTAKFYGEHKAAIPAAPTNSTVTTEQVGSLGDLDHSTNTIAAHLNATSGSELAIAAAAHLTFVQKKDKFSRQEINTEMKGATTYYKANMSSNLTKSLSTLVKSKRLNQIAKDTYALSATERKELEGKLAESL